MEKRQKTLSICIPTWNRSDKLDRILQSIQTEAKGLENEIEICISSNGSTDNTDNVVSAWAKKLPIKYRKNDHNTGFDFNMLSVLKMAGGEYCWILGDDDALTDGAVKKLLEDIQSLGKKELGAIYINILHPDGRKFNDLPEGPFKVYSWAKADYHPISVLSMNCICLHQKTMAEIIEKKVYTEGDRVFKKEEDHDVLHLWIQSYLFLECARKHGAVGIEPAPLARLIMDGAPNLSYIFKIYTDVCALNYVYDLKKNYPEFKENFFKLRLEMYFLRLNMACERPELEAAHRAANLVFLKLLEMDGRHIEVQFIKLIEVIRKIPFMPTLIQLAYKAFLLFRGHGNALRNYEEADPEPMKSLNFITNYTEKKFRQV